MTSVVRTGVSSAYDRAIQPAKSWSLTARLVVVLVVLLIVALTLANVATQAVLRSYLGDRTTDDLRAAGRVAAANSLYQVDPSGHVFVPGLPGSYAVEFLDRQGRRHAGWAPADDNDAPVFPKLTAEDPRVVQGTPFLVASDTHPEERWEVVAGPLNDGSGLYAVAVPLRGIDQTVAQLRGLSLAIGLVVAAACAVAGYVAVKRAFRPLRLIEDTAAAIADGDLTRRIPPHAAKDEVASLSRSLNAMLAQIESSFAVREASEERMRRFVTDASHELRTPLATVRGYAELYRQGAAAGPEATSAAMRRIEDEATRMSALVEDLLTLARMDQGRVPVHGPVDLTVLAADAVSDAKARDPERPVRLVGIGAAPLGPTELVGDEAQLRQVVTNLVANAFHHTPIGTPVEVAVGRGSTDGALRLEVRDHGPGVPPELVDQVFQRFYRGDPARGRTERGVGGTGLGLAIVMAIVTAHGGRVGIRRTHGGGATFVVVLPDRPGHPLPPLDDRPAGAGAAMPQTPVGGRRSVLH